MASTCLSAAQWGTRIPNHAGPQTVAARSRSGVATRLSGTRLCEKGVVPGVQGGLVRPFPRGDGQARSASLLARGPRPPRPEGAADRRVRPEPRGRVARPCLGERRPTRVRRLLELLVRRRAKATPKRCKRPSGPTSRPTARMSSTRTRSGECAPSSTSGRSSRASYGPFKAVWVVRFKDEIRSDPARTREAHEHWIETHGGRFGRDVRGIGRYVQNHCVAPLGGGRGPDRRAAVRRVLGVLVRGSRRLRARHELPGVARDERRRHDVL